MPEREFILTVGDLVEHLSIHDPTDPVGIVVHTTDPQGLPFSEVEDGDVLYPFDTGHQNGVGVVIHVANQPDPFT